MSEKYHSISIRSLNLSITGDTAKYLVSSFYRGGALSPQDLIFTKTGPFRSLPLDQMDVFQPIIPLPSIVQMTKFWQLM